MIGKEIIENEPIPSAKVKEILEEFSNEHELNYEQNLTLNHLSRFKKYSVEDTEEIMEADVEMVEETEEITEE